MEDDMISKNPVPKLKKVKDSQLAGYARGLVKVFANATNLNPSLSVTEVEADCDALDVAEAEAENGGAAAMTKRNELRFKVKKDLGHWKDYVAGLIETKTTHAEALTIITGAGMLVRKATSKSKQELAAKNLMPSGTVRLVAQAAKGRAAYYWEYSVDQQDWKRTPDTLKASTTIADLTPMTTYYLRFHTRTRKGESPLSQVVSLLVL
jgi:hypothetical protein